MTQTFTERRWTSPDGLCLFARDYPAASGPARLPVIDMLRPPPWR